MAENGFELRSENHFHGGANVKVTYGVFSGLEGVVVKQNSGTRLIVGIDSI